MAAIFPNFYDDNPGTSSGRVPPIQTARKTYALTSTDIANGVVLVTPNIPVAFKDSNYTALVTVQSSNFGSNALGATFLPLGIFGAATNSQIQIWQKLGAGAQAGDVLTFHCLFIYDKENAGPF